MCFDFNLILYKTLEGKKWEIQKNSFRDNSRKPLFLAIIIRLCQQQHLNQLFYHLHE